MRSKIVPLALTLLVVAAEVARAQAPTPVRYRVRVDDPLTQLYHVEATFPATGATTLLSLPAWTPGHYEVEDYALHVRDFSARSGERRLDWDKLDKDTWRVQSAGVQEVTVAFDYLADTADLSASVLREDFGFFNGTNLFLFSETGYDVPAELRLELPEGWRAATELADAGEPFVFRAADYHELADNPTFIGHFAMDSAEVDGIWMRLAVYPGGYLREPAREMAMTALTKIAEVCHELFDGPPYDRYTTFVLLEDELAFIAGLEHAESHVDIMPALLFQQPRFSFRAYIYGLFSHEIYHAWNVKRIRPAGLWPYDYDVEQPTPLLWVSEGITDYYAHVILTRAGLWGENEFWLAVRGAIGSVTGQPRPVAVEDASLDTWMEAPMGERYIYYDKGALLGLLLDIKIRHATENRASLDDVMRRLFREHYARGHGFTTDDFNAYLAEYLGEDETRRFYRDYVDGRQPLPLRETLALAGMSYEADTIAEPFLGVLASPDREGRVVVRDVEPASTADRAGLRSGDVLVSIGALEIEGDDWSQEFRKAFDRAGDTEVAITYRRGDESISKRVVLGSHRRYEHSLAPAENADERELRLKRAILAGSVEKATGVGGR